MAHIDSKRKDLLSFKDVEKIAYEMTTNTVKCKCSHSIIMPKADRTICSHCGIWCYRNKQIEFRYKMKEKLISERRNMERH